MRLATAAANETLAQLDKIMVFVPQEGKPAKDRGAGSIAPLMRAAGIEVDLDAIADADGVQEYADSPTWAATVERVGGAILEFAKTHGEAPTDTRSYTKIASANWDGLKQAILSAQD